MKRIILCIMLLMFGFNGYAQTETTHQNIKMCCCGNTDPSQQALLIINGKPFDMKYMGGLNVNMITAVSVFKRDEAIKKYGEKAKNGVIVITTKKEAKWNSVLSILKKNKIKKENQILPIIYNGELLQVPFIMTDKNKNYVATISDVSNVKLNNRKFSGKYLFINETNN